MLIDIEKLQAMNRILTRVQFKQHIDFSSGLPYEEVAKCLEGTDIYYSLVGEKPNLELVIIAEDWERFEDQARAMFGNDCYFRYSSY